MKSVLDRLNNEITLRYQEVVLLACLFNAHQEECGISPEALVSREQFPHLIVKAFAHVLGKAFVACSGEVLCLSRDIFCAQGVSADLRFRATREVVGVKTWSTTHSWLYLSEYDTLIDVIPPGSDPSWLSPVKYLPSKSRPPYMMKALSGSEAPHFSDVRALANLLDTLLKEKGPFY